VYTKTEIVHTLRLKVCRTGKEIPPQMEEQQIKEFVHRVSCDEELRKELAQNPDGVLMREGFSPRVMQVVMRLVPHLTVSSSVDFRPNYWWN
jgi:hypothetical protein